MVAVLAKQMSVLRIYIFVGVVDKGMKKSKMHYKENKIRKRWVEKIIQISLQNINVFYE